MEHEDPASSTDILLTELLTWLTWNGHAPVLGLGSSRHHGIRRVARPGPEFDRELNSLFQEHRDQFLARARQAGAGDAAEDVVQTAFMNVWRGQQSQPKEIINLRYYVVTAVRNEVYVELRRRQRLPLADGGEDALADLPSGHSETGTRVVTAMAVRDALLRLPSPHREVAVLRFIDDYNMARTAELTGLTVDKVKRITHEAVLRLRAALPPEAA